MTLHDLDTKFHEIQNDHFYTCCLFDREQADRKLMRAIILVKNMAENELRYIPDMTDDQKNMLQLLTKALNFRAPPISTDRWNTSCIRSPNASGAFWAFTIKKA